MKEDAQMKKWIQEAGRSKPSAQFEDVLMSRIMEMEKSASTYKPLISKKGWMWVFLGTMAVLALVLLSPGGMDTSYLLGLNEIMQMKLFTFSSGVSSLPFSDSSIGLTQMNPIYAYGFLAMGLLVSLQVYLDQSRLKRS